jgi:hypothetical protein
MGEFIPLKPPGFQDQGWQSRRFRQRGQAHLARLRGMLNRPLVIVFFAIFRIGFVHFFGDDAG